MAKDKRNTVVNHNYSLRKYNENGYSSFGEFYPYYLGEHCNRTNRRLHLIGTTFAVLLSTLGVISGYNILLLGALLQGYLFAWIGHFCFEKNKPATFKHPFYSVISNYGTKWCEASDHFKYINDSHHWYFHLIHIINMTAVK